MNEKTKENYSRLKIFLGLTFLITWTSWWFLAYLIQTERILFASTIGQLLLIIGGTSPTLVAYIAVRLTKEQADIAEFNTRAFKTKIGVNYYLFVLLPLFLGLIGITGSSLIQSDYLANYPPAPLFLFLPLFLSGIIFGGLEEFGWRGILQHELRFASINLHLKNLIIAAIWSFWHLPFFFIAGLTHYQASFLAFTLGAIGFSSLMTYLYEKTESIFICVLFHATINAVAGISLSVTLIETNFYIMSSIIAIIVGHGLLQRQMTKNG